MTKRRVVITGMGMISPLGNNVNNTWQGIINGKSGIDNIKLFDCSDISSKVAGEVSCGEGENEFNINQFVEPKEQKKSDRFIHLAIGAAEEAIKDSGWTPSNDEERFRTGVMIGSGIGGLPSIESTANLIKDRGPKKN